MPSNIHENKKRWKVLFTIIIILNLLVLFQLPLCASFLFTKPKLQHVVDRIKSGEFYKDINYDNIKDSDSNHDDKISTSKYYDPYIYTGIFVFDRTEIHPEGSTNPEMIEFRLADDHEAAFIYCITGLDSIFTTGAKGHLWGNWYWKKDD